MNKRALCLASFYLACAAGCDGGQQPKPAPRPKPEPTAAQKMSSEDPATRAAGLDEAAKEFGAPK